MQSKQLEIKYKTILLHLEIYETIKDNPSIIFIPGMILHIGLYSNFLKSLAKKGFNVIAFDLQGQGKSGGKRGVFTYEDLIGNVAQVVEYVFQNYNEKIGIFGSSLGGIIAFYGALLNPKIKAAVCHIVLDLKGLSFFPILNKRPFLIPIVKFLSIFLRPINWLSLPINFFIKPQKMFKNQKDFEKLQKDPLCVWHYQLSSLISLFLTPKNKPSIEEMKKPVRIIIGEKDSLFLYETIKDFYNRLNCKKDLKIVPLAGHMLPLEFPSILASLVTDWFNETLK